MNDEETLYNRADTHYSHCSRPCCPGCCIHSSTPSSAVHRYKTTGSLWKSKRNYIRFRTLKHISGIDVVVWYIFRCPRVSEKMGKTSTLQGCCTWGDKWHLLFWMEMLVHITDTHPCHPSSDHRRLRYCHLLLSSKTAPHSGALRDRQRAGTAHETYEHLYAGWKW